ncbi:MAG: right-handed parallel beta-helix repeat-containing protein [Verrucomicrobiales bacterium]|nr:right-handed parallel beta-helix repeat-containing protein [Verrucomicrobiales bacterium]
MSARCGLDERRLEQPDPAMGRELFLRCFFRLGIFLLLVCCPRVSGGLTIYVSPTGDDAMTGKREAPLATINEALLRLRGKTDKREIVLLSGIHQLRKPVQLGASDSGLPGRPLRIRGEGEVCLSGYLDLPAAGWSKVTEPRDLSRVKNTADGERLMRFRFHDVDRPKLGGMSPRGIAARGNARIPPAMLYLAGDRMRLARWPNAGGVAVLGMSGDMQAGDDAGTGSRILRINSSRPGQWKTFVDTWVNGFLGDNREWGVARVEKVSNEGHEIGIGNVDLNDGVAEPLDCQGVFFENVFEELDEPNEYFIDVARGLVFFLPPENDLNWESSARLSWSEHPLISIEEARYIALSGFKVEGTRGEGIVVKDGLSIQLEDIAVRHCGGDGVVLAGRDIRVTRLMAEDIGGRGMVLEGGDPVSLMASGNMVVNSTFVSCGWWNPSWHPAMELVGVGHQVRNCMFSDLPHMALQFSGNDFLIEGCWFHRSCRNPQQMGAIYARLGDRPHMRGTVIRGNLFQDIGRWAEEPGGAIYLADGTMGVSISGNVFHRVGAGENGQAVIVEGGAHVTVANNIFIDCPVPFRLGFMPSTNGSAGRMAAWRSLLTSDATRKHLLRYRNLNNFFIEDRDFPDTNSFIGNRIANGRVSLLADKGYAVSGGPEEKLKVSGNSLSGALRGISFDSGGRPIIPGRLPWHSVKAVNP